MARLGSDLENGDIIGFCGQWWCAGLDSLHVYVEVSSSANMEMDELLTGSGIYRKWICGPVADDCMPTLEIGDDGRLRIVVPANGRLYTYMITDIAQQAVLVDTL